MTSFTISDGELGDIKDQVVLITGTRTSKTRSSTILITYPGASSGIGLATLRRVIKHGGKVFACDLNPLPEPEASSIPFMKVDVASWKEQLELFKAAQKQYGKIDHVFANAGIVPSMTLLEDDVDENGDLLPPKKDTIDVNLIGCLYTVKLAIHYLKKNPNGGSIVMTASGSSFSRFPGADYSTSPTLPSLFPSDPIQAICKHAILGILRALYTPLYPNLPIRINAVAPSWTNTPLMTREVVAALGEGNCQSADVVARSVVLLMSDGKRHGEMVYSKRGNYTEMENGDKGFHALVKGMFGVGLKEERIEVKNYKKLSGVLAEMERKGEEHV
jgi:NAD(P)-dependent dehydrogenase (short-subunit alcohol dehydrogenase family)